MGIWVPALVLITLWPLLSNRASAQTPPPAPQTPAAPVSASGDSSPAPANVERQPTALTVKADRTRLLAGQEYHLTLTVADAQCEAMALPDQVDSVLAGSPHDLVVGKRSSVQGKNCLLSVHVTVPADALAGTVPMLLVGKDGTVLGSVVLDIASTNPIPASPIPPGLTPQVDMMWKVLPRQVVADNYGDRVADGFFAIEATFGNNTGYDIQVAALGFLPPEVKCDEFTGLASGPKPVQGKQPPPLQPQPFQPLFPFQGCSLAKPPVGPHGIGKEAGRMTLIPLTQDPASGPILPVDAYPVVRGTVEREQSVGTRAIVVNVVRSTGPILLGIGGGITSLNENLTLASGLLSGPFDKGLELIWPDLTIQHLLNLDSHTLRDNVVIANNSAIRVNAFLSRELVMCGFPQKWYNRFARSSSHVYDCTPGDARLQYAKTFDPYEVMGRLGRMTLIGQQIQYINRMRVVEGKTTDVVAGPLVTNPVISVTAGNAVDGLVFAGINLQGVTVVSTDTTIKLNSHPAAADGSSVSFGVDPGKTPAGFYPLFLVSTHGTTVAQLRVDPAPAPTN